MPRQRYHLMPPRMNGSLSTSSSSRREKFFTTHLISASLSPNLISSSMNTGFLSASPAATGDVGAPEEDEVRAARELDSAAGSGSMGRATPVPTGERRVSARGHASTLALLTPPREPPLPTPGGLKGRSAPRLLGYLED